MGSAGRASCLYDDKLSNCRNKNLLLLICLELKKGFISVFENILFARICLVASDAERACKRASFHSHMGLLNNVISCKLLIFSIWSIEQKILLFEHIIDIRDDPARPASARLGPARP